MTGSIVPIPEGFQELPVSRVGPATRLKDQEYWLLQLPAWLNLSELDGVKVKLPTAEAADQEAAEGEDEGAKFKLEDGTRLHMLEQMGASRDMKLIMGAAGTTARFS